MKNSYSLILLIFVFSLGHVVNAQMSVETKTLVNGVEVSKDWPPEYIGNIQRKSLPVPYLNIPQETIPIDGGRQLFVDNFLIESTNLRSIQHIPKFSNRNPVLTPDREWEYNSSGPFAAPFSDGIWFDEIDDKYKMWYLAGKQNSSSYYTCYAESYDGIAWEKPDLGVYGHTNIVDTCNRDASTTWLDKNEQDLTKRYKMFNIEHDKLYHRFQAVLKYSSDGIHWSKGVAQSGDIFDRTTFFYNPFLQKWVLSMRSDSEIGRSRSYAEHEDPEMLVSLTHRLKKEAGDANITFWLGADDKEPRNPHFPDIEPQLYNFDAIAYESLMLGFFTIWQGPDNDVTAKEGIQKRNEVLIGYSRDGFHWSRPSHKPFMGVNETEGSWNWANVQSIGGMPIIKGDSLYFYSSGRKLNTEKKDTHISTGLATLRRDGFVSMSSDDEGFLLTRPLTFSGSYLFINADIPDNGELRVEVLDENNRVLKGYGKADCIPMKENNTRYLIRWKDHDNLSLLTNKRLYFRFLMEKGDIYSFWVSPWISGESRGFTAGGGPGLSETGVDEK
jgi:hypothetical protein